MAAAGRCCVLDIDVQGARLVRRSGLRAVFVFVAPPSSEELERRLRGRGTESEAQVAERLATAKQEIARRAASAGASGCLLITHVASQIKGAFAAMAGLRVQTRVHAQRACRGAWVASATTGTHFRLQGLLRARTL